MKSITQSIPCLVRGQRLTMRLAKGRKSQKTFLTPLGTEDGRHFRAFINDRAFVDRVLSRLEGHAASAEPRAGLEDGTRPSRRSKTNVERGS